MKKILFITSMILFTLGSTFAQQGGGQGRGQGEGRGQGRQNMSSEERAKQYVVELKKDIKDLTPEQVTKIEKISIKYSNKMRTEMENMRSSGGDRESMRETMRATMTKMNKERNTELKGVFTEKQYKIFEAKEKERIENRKKRMEQRGTRSSGSGGSGRPR